MTNRLAQNFQIFVECIGNLYRNPLKTWSPILLSAIMLSLPTGIYMNASIFGFMSELVDQPAELTVFLKKDVGPDTAILIQQRILEMPAVESATLISKDDALEDFKQLTGLNAITNYVQENPFAPMVVIQPASENVNAQGYQDLSANLYRLEYVDLVEFDREWAEKLSSLRVTVKEFGMTFYILLLIAAVFVVCYATLWQFQGQDDKFKLLTLIGAKRSFIYRPLVYTTFIQTILVVLIAFAIVKGHRVLNEDLVVNLLELYQVDSSKKGVMWPIWAYIGAGTLFLKIGTIRIVTFFKLRKFEER